MRSGTPTILDILHFLTKFLLGKNFVVNIGELNLELVGENKFAFFSRLSKQLLLQCIKKFLSVYFTNVECQKNRIFFHLWHLAFSILQQLPIFAEAFPKQ